MRKRVFKTKSIRVERQISNLIRYLSLLLFSVLPSYGQADCSGTYRNPVLDLRFLHKAAIICDQEKDPTCEKKLDNRETYEEYAANPERKISLDEVYNRYSATGGFYCGGVPYGGANVVRRNNILVLAAHQFYKGRQKNAQCKPQPLWKDFSSCYFETIGRNGEKGQRYYIKPSTLKIGTKCPGDFNMSDDWAVVELKDAVKGVRVYSPVDVKKDLLGSPDDGYDTLVGLKTTTVTAMNERFEKNGRKYSPETPALCDDRIRGFGVDTSKAGSKTYFIGNACSSTPGTSGGAILLQSLRPIPYFIGVIHGGSDSEWDHKPYGPKNYTSGALLEGRFYDALMSM